MTDAELRHRILKLEATVKRLTQRIAELEGRPQPAMPISGAGNWPWPQPHTVLSKSTGSIGTNVSRETLED